MRDSLFYTIGIALTSGIFIRSFFDIGYIGIALSFVIGSACVLAWRLNKNNANYRSPLFMLGLTILCGAVGIWRMHQEEIQQSALIEHVGEQMVFNARIEREPDIRETNVQIYVKPENGIDELVLVTVNRFENENQDLSYGDSVRVEGVLKLPEAFEADEGRMFDYPGYLKVRGVNTMIAFGKIEVMQQEDGTFFGYLFRGKKSFQKTLEEIIPEPYAGLGEGLLLGVKRALGESLEETFRETGIIHIVVLSGYNIMIVVEFFMFILSFFFFPRARLVIGGGIVVLFALLVGLSATVVRASVMAILLLVARTTGRTYAVLRALTFAGVLMLLWNPYLLAHDPGFQLSFLATLGLILVAPWIESYFTRIPAVFGLRSAITATVSTQLFVLPLLLYHMGLFSVVALFVNALVLPMVPVAMFLTFVTGLVGTVSLTLGYPLGFLAHLSLQYIVSVAELFGSLPFASFTVRAFPFWIVFAVYALFAVVLMHYSHQKNGGNVVMANDVTYDDWTIVEETEVQISPETLRVSGDTKSKLPFR